MSSGGGSVSIGGGSSAGSSGDLGFEMYSDGWWFWSRSGRALWKKCQKKGKDSDFWKRRKCGTRAKPARGSKWWWWTRSGRRAWRECKAKGKGSSFWKENDCGSGR